MDRRKFLKATAALGVTGLAANVPLAQAAAATMKTQEAVGSDTITHAFKFHNGKFKVLQFTDTHYIAGDPRSIRALNNVREMLDAERPDLVIHTGDIIFGKPAEQGLREILAPISERKIPFVVALGNHDGQHDLTRKGVADTVKTIPYCLNKCIDNIYGDTNELVTLGTSTDGAPEWVFYLFDSGDINTIPGMEGYDFIHFDQIAWHRQWAEKFKAKNGGTPIPSMAFFHIPVPEFTYALRDTKRIMKGNLGEDPCPADINSGLFTSFKEMGDIKAIVCGHDHDNDYAMKWKGMFLIYGRFSGCDTVYNNLKPNGARIFEFTQGQSTFRSWIHEYGGNISQKLDFPDGFKTY